MEKKEMKIVNTIDNNFDYQEYNNELIAQEKEFTNELRALLTKTSAELIVHPETGIHVMLPEDKTIGQYKQAFHIGWIVNQFNI